MDDSRVRSGAPAHSKITAGDTFGIGSLPFAEVTRAVAHVFSKYTIPFLPELPGFDPSEGMIARVLWGMEDLRLEKGGWVSFARGPLGELRDRLNPDHPSHAKSGGLAWPSFLARAAEHDGPVKIQHVGPYTLARCVFLPNGTPLIDQPEGLALCHALVLNRLRWMIRELKKNGVREILAFLDEPLLGFEKEEEEHAAGHFQAELQSRLEDAVALLHNTSECKREGERVRVGLHACGPAPWDTIIAAGVEILSLDAVKYLDDLLQHRAALTAHVQCGGWIGWGVVSTNEQDRTGVDRYLERLFLRLDADLSEIRELILRQSLLSPACGTGRLSEAREEKITLMLLKARSNVQGLIEH